MTKPIYVVMSYKYGFSSLGGEEVPAFCPALFVELFTGSYQILKVEKAELSTWRSLTMLNNTSALYIKRKRISTQGLIS